MMSGPEEIPENKRESFPCPNCDDPIDLMSRGQKTSQFERVAEARLQRTRQILVVKAKEYAVDGNRYHNFDVAARMLDTTPECALWGMAAKHLVSVVDLVKDPSDASNALVDEKIGDLINYLILLEGLLKRRLEDEQMEDWQ